LEVLSILETSAILFCACSKRDVRLVGINVLASMVAIVHSSEAFADCDIPVDKYERLVADARRAASLTTRFACSGSA
jgi:hypothetical protein